MAIHTDPFPWGCRDPRLSRHLIDMSTRSPTVQGSQGSYLAALSSQGILVQPCQILSYPYPFDIVVRDGMRLQHSFYLSFTGQLAPSSVQGVPCPSGTEHLPAPVEEPFWVSHLCSNSSYGLDSSPLPLLRGQSGFRTLGSRSIGPFSFLSLPMTPLVAGSSSPSPPGTMDHALFVKIDTSEDLWRLQASSGLQDEDHLVSGQVESIHQHRRASGSSHFPPEISIHSGYVNMFPSG